MFDLTDPIFSDKDAAREHLESLRWVDGRFCPHCGEAENTSPVKGKRKGLYYCNGCKKQFTVTVGTLFERSKIPLNRWIAAFHLMTASKKGISAHQLHRMLGITYKSAWFMAHRIREAMRPGKDDEPFGGPGKIVEVDETVIGGKERNKHKSKRNPKNIGAVGKETAFALVERGGRVRSHHVTSVSAKNLRPIMMSQIDRKSTLMTDDAGQYRVLGPEFARYESVNHRIEEYVRGDAHTNTIEGYFSLLKRGINGTYHHVSPKHLKRYLAEFDFRYNERAALGVGDVERAHRALKGIEGKRLTYRRTAER